jgi:hypothetical protein
MANDDSKVLKDVLNIHNRPDVTPLTPLQLNRLIDSTLSDKNFTQESLQKRIRIIAEHVTTRLNGLVPVTTLTETINHSEQTLPDNLQTVLMSKNFLGLRNILKHLISSEETKDFFSKSSIRSAKNLLGIFEALEKKHSPTHIATRIKELILGQGISAEDFSSLVYAGRPDDESLSQCTEEQLFIIVSKQFESINENFQPTQPQEGLPIERKLQNLLEKTEFLDLVGILTHLTPYTPNNDTAHVMLDFLVMTLSSLDYQQPPLETEKTPKTPETQTTPHTLKLAEFLQRHQQQQQPA